MKCPKDRRGADGVVYGDKTRISPKRIAADANAWADKLRADRVKSEARTVAAPVTTNPKAAA
jgi:hypothetical protein